MKRILFIIILIVSINFSAPIGRSTYIRLKNNIEFNQDYKDELSNNEVLKSKVEVFLKLQILLLISDKLTSKMQFDFDTS